jgi:hypothetical protein
MILDDGIAAVGEIDRPVGQVFVVEMFVTVGMDYEVLVPVEIHATFKHGGCHNNTVQALVLLMEIADPEVSVFLHLAVVHHYKLSHINLRVFELRTHGFELKP